MITIRSNEKNLQAKKKYPTTFLTHLCDILQKHQKNLRSQQTSAKQAAKALLAKVPAKEMSDLALESATMFLRQRNERNLYSETKRKAEIFKTTKFVKTKEMG